MTYLLAIACGLVGFGFGMLAERRAESQSRAREVKSKASLYRLLKETQARQARCEGREDGRNRESDDV